ncbi:Na/Pi cotransporter family protein [Peptoniphilus catoniae]|uniref:Na/Pi cotransporter family protein n=1 Tax=Peptoniphilus catoniae TaxID=1660341 RepID=UPI0010FD715A|nr:Na/Pi cotransporter family protein [Peptoniphilus catoniae]
MSINYLLGLLGGLVLFLYGMELMSSSLELVAGRKMHNIIEKITSNPLKGVLVGAIVTAIIQSSSATTVMTVGFVNARLMTIPQAVGIIMGANIGTTITGQLVALNITKVAPAMAFLGFVVYKASKKERIKYLGRVVLGLGMLFIGMQMMSDSMSPLKDEPVFVDLMTRFENPFLGVAVGAIFTAIIQSSSSSLGILQAISNQGLIGLSSSMYIIFGFNIGTCITSVLSAVGASKNAQRTSAVHVLFNLIGTIIFIIIAKVVPVSDFVVGFSKNTGAAQVANMHTLFNIVTTILLFPFSKKLALLASKIIPGEDEEADSLSLQYITDRNMIDPNIAITNVRAETNRMLKLARENYELSMNIFRNFEEDQYEKVFRNEETINFLNSNITRYIIDVLGDRMNDALAQTFTDYMRIVRDIERIGDHIKSIAEFAKSNVERELAYTQMSAAELKNIEIQIETMFELVEAKKEGKSKKEELRELNKKIEIETIQYRQFHVERMKTGVCDPESGLIYEKILTALERVSSYLSNAGKLML